MTDPTTEGSNHRADDLLKVSSSLLSFISGFTTPSGCVVDPNTLVSNRTCQYLKELARLRVLCYELFRYLSDELACNNRNTRWLAQSPVWQDFHHFVMTRQQQYARTREL